MALITGAWHQITYASYAKLLHPAKFNKKYPDPQDLYREVTFSISTTLMGTGFEAAMLRLYATGAVKNYFLDW